jgi:hypothetical protein
MRRVFLLLVVLLVLALVWQKFQKPLFVPQKSITSTPLYTSLGNTKTTVSIFDEEIAGISHIEITPDGNYMLVATLQGTIWVYQNIDGMFRRQTKPFFTLSTSQPGFPPEEAGLTGIGLGADFESSGDVFLTYSFAVEKKSFRNRVMRLTFSKKGKNVVGTSPTQIFEAKTPGSGSHQIQKGVGVMVEGKPHFIFTIGEGFVSERALDPNEEAGKVMLIGRDGSDPVGVRPFPESPKVQALGIRNAPALARNPVNGNIAIGDTGPNNYDRFLYGKLFDPEGKNAHPISFNWDGSEESLQKGAKDIYDNNKEMILYRWSPTETAVNISFFEHEKLPTLTADRQYVLVDLFGRTGEKGIRPGKSIMLGILSHGATNSITLSPLIGQTEEGKNTLGHPIGLAVDPKTRDIYFGDIMEGKIYKASIDGGR